MVKGYGRVQTQGKVAAALVWVGVVFVIFVVFIVVDRRG
jgi:hypothetical protein